MLLAVARYRNRYAFSKVQYSDAQKSHGSCPAFSPQSLIFWGKYLTLAYPRISLTVGLNIALGKMPESVGSIGPTHTCRRNQIR